MTQPDTSNSRPAPAAVFLSWLALTAAVVCVLLWTLDKHPSRWLLVGGLAGLLLWAGIWLDDLDQRLQRGHDGPHQDQQPGAVFWECTDDVPTTYPEAE